MQGILVTPVDAYSPLLDDIARHTPLVIVDRTRGDDSFCTAAADDVEGGRQALEHLIDQGHDRVAYIGGPEALGQVRDRKLGASLAWEKAGLPPDDLLTITTPALGFADGRAAGERLAGVPKRRRPTAAFCANDLVALGLLQHVILSGLRVPDDLAIVGFDDIDFAGAAAVPLTSVRQPRHELGRAAAELLLDEADNPDHVHQQISFTPELVGAGVDGRLTPIAARYSGAASSSASSLRLRRLSSRLTCRFRSSVTCTMRSRSPWNWRWTVILEVSTTAPQIRHNLDCATTGSPSGSNHTDTAAGTPRLPPSPRRQPRMPKVRGAGSATQDAPFGPDCPDPTLRRCGPDVRRNA